MLSPYTKGRVVLDVGCASGVDHMDWLHRRLSESAEKIVGLDVDPVGVEKMRSEGFSCILADGDDFELDFAVDTVVAGEVIEHMDNPGRFLDNCRSCLVADGTIVITTPNPFAFSNFVYRLFGQPVVNRDHVMWFCHVTLRQLLERHGFEVVRESYVPHRTPGKLRRAVAQALRSILPERLRWGSILTVAVVSPDSSGN